MSSERTAADFLLLIPAYSHVASRPNSLHMRNRALFPAYSGLGILFCQRDTIFRPKRVNELSIMSPESEVQDS